MDDTRVIARMPTLEVEVRHKNAADEGAEYVVVTVKATPDLASVVALFDPFGVVRTLAALNPLLAMMMSANPFLAPLIPVAARDQGAPMRPTRRYQDLAPPASQLH